ncbi:PepSY domain-containing protein [Aliihoeflea sp. PC F10.4]
MKKLMVLCVAGMVVSGPAMAQDIDPTAKAENGKRPSEILTSIEDREDFRYLEEMEWNDDGYYSIVYHTADKARVEIHIDALSGEPVDNR